MRYERLRFLIKMAIRRPWPRPYRFCLLPDRRGCLRVRITPRDRQGAATVELRPNSGDSLIFAQVFFDAAYDLTPLARWPEIETLARAAPQPLLLDLGANVGFAALALHWQFPRARILAVEPEPHNFAQLCRNVAGIEAIVPVQAAVAAADGWVQLVNAGRKSSDFRTVPASSQPGAAIPASSIETLWRRAGLRPDYGTPLLVKMDVEGAERDLFFPGCPWLERTPLLIVEPHDWLLPHQSLSHGLLAALTARGGDVVVRGEHLICWQPALASQLAPAQRTAA
ncbi:MAG: FkbM family methyltransferase [Acidobacteria bacterium]|nr:MAG: FkbM family methyltransferase [Acidobacteriota bacterium]